jgi:hypothetical protein
MWCSLYVRNLSNTSMTPNGTKAPVRKAPSNIGISATTIWMTYVLMLYLYACDKNVYTFDHWVFARVWTCAISSFSVCFSMRLNAYTAVVGKTAPTTKAPSKIGRSKTFIWITVTFVIVDSHIYTHMWEKDVWGPWRVPYYKTGIHELVHY